MLTHVAVVAIACLLCVVACSCAVERSRDGAQRETISLAGMWRFQPDGFVKGETLGYEQTHLNDQRWPLVRVPSSFGQAQIPAMEHYVGAGWFRQRVSVPENWRDKDVVLRFDGVNDHARVWVNGQKVGEEHNDPYLPFEVPVGAALRFGQENLIAVRVDNFRGPHDLPGHLGWRHFGGILREVALEARPAVHVGDVSIVADHGGRFASTVAIVNTADRPVDVTVACRVEDSGHREAMRITSASVSVGAKSTTQVNLSGQGSAITPWSPDRPALYWASYALTVGAIGPHGEGDIERRAAVDRHAVRFGFRSIKAAGEHLLLNGQSVFLTGFNRHEDSPRTDMCPDPQLVRQDLLAMKRAGANFVRLAHYPHDTSELDLCDELGLLVMCEIPMYWWAGLEEDKENYEPLLATAGRQLTAMIARDRNHPSVIVWSVSNETVEKRPGVAEGNARLVRLARELDPTRLATHVSRSVEWVENPHYEADDVLCVNGYPTWKGWWVDPRFTPRQAAAWWRDNLKKLHEQHPGRPILVSEFGYPSIAGVAEGAFGEDIHVKALVAEWTGMQAPYVCGATVWCWADHPWPPNGGMAGIITSPYGVMTRNRTEKPALGAIRSLFLARQGRPEAGASTAPPGEAWLDAPFAPVLGGSEIPSPDGRAPDVRSMFELKDRKQ